MAVDGATAERLSAQRTYYDLRAPDYLNERNQSDRKGDGRLELQLVSALIGEFGATGDVLELACGPGFFTWDLARHARSVTAVDGSARMLERARAAVADANVTLVCADIFSWTPGRSYDAIFFGHWLSHVPPTAFEQFWALVSTWLASGGRVGFVDEDDRANVHDDSRILEGLPTARRTLSDGRQFDIVKVFWEPSELEMRLRSLGWEFAIHRVGESSMFGVGELR